LVTRDGVQIETRGAWEVKGRRVVFRSARGTLSSMRRSELDLEASQRLTEERAQHDAHSAEATGIEHHRRSPVLVLTDEDVQRGEGSSAERSLGPSRSGTGEPSGSPSSDGVAVEKWRHEVNESINGVEVAGTLHNGSDNAAVDLQMVVLLYSDRIGLVGTVAATIETRLLRPGESCSFVAAFPGLRRFDRADFSITSIPAPTAKPKPRR
jgi:hypothetical protein